MSSLARVWLEKPAMALICQFILDDDMELRSDIYASNSVVSEDTSTSHRPKTGWSFISRSKLSSDNNIRFSELTDTAVEVFARKSKVDYRIELRSKTSLQ